YWLSYVSVPNLEHAVEQVKASRGAVLHGPADVPGGDRIAQLRDPHGAFFAMHWSAKTPGSQVAAKPAAKKPAAAKAPAKPLAKAAPKGKKKAKTLAKTAKT